MGRAYRNPETMELIREQIDNAQMETVIAMEQDEDTEGQKPNERGFDRFQARWNSEDKDYSQMDEMQQAEERMKRSWSL